MVIICPLVDSVVGAGVVVECLMSLKVDFNGEIAESTQLTINSVQLQTSIPIHLCRIIPIQLAFKEMGLGFNTRVLSRDDIQDSINYPPKLSKTR